MEMNQIAVEVMKHLVTCYKHGYTQGNRWGDGKTEKIKIGGKEYTIATGDRDCSSAVINAWKTAGLNVNATYTGNMRKGFLDTGLFEWKPMSFSAQPGDIYLNEGMHTAMCITPYGSDEGDILAEFSISENGTIYGKAGDQTGRESILRPYYNYPWNGILHYKGNGAKNGSKAPSSAKTATATKAKSAAVKKVTLTYRLALKKSGWLPWVKDYNNKHTDGYAGAKTGTHTAMEAKVDRGSIRYRVHGANTGWSGWKKDGKTATAEPWIDAIQMYYETPKGEPYQQAWYRASTGGNYLPVCCDDGTVIKAYDGWAGLYGSPIDRLQAYVGTHSTY